MSNDLNLNMQQLKVFVAVARVLSFSKATLAPPISQPAISLQIQALESQIGKPLFSRSGGGKVELTDEGKMLLEIVAPLVKDFDSIKTRFNEMQDGELKGPLRIATHSSVMMTLLPDVIRKFKKKHPACELSILNRGRQDIVSMLENAEVDLGITSLAKPLGNINYEVFARFKRLLITPIAHPLSEKPQISLKDIAAYPLLLPPQGSNTREIVDKKFTGQGLTYALAMETTGKFVTKSYVKMGLGISIVNEFYLEKEDENTLFIADVSKYFGYAERGVLTRGKGYISRAATAFKEILLEKYRVAV